MKKRIISVFLLLCLCLGSFLSVSASAAEDLYDAVLKNNNALRGRYLEPDTSLDNSVDSSIFTMAFKMTYPLKTDYEKIKLLYRWVTDNIYYDYDYFSGKTKTTATDALDVFTTKYTVCEGYANLMTELLRSIGIPCIVVEGYALGVGEAEAWSASVINGSQTNHAWNEAYADGKWIILDATWDSENRYENGTFYKGSSMLTYFDISDAAFAKDHFIVRRESTVLANEIRTEGDFSYYVEGGGATVLGWSDAARTARLEIPETLGGCPVLAIADNAFEDEYLDSLSFPYTLRTIGYQAFYGAHLTGKVLIPASVKSISSYAFSYMYGVRAFEVSALNTAYASHDGVLLDKSMQNLYFYPLGNSRSSYRLPDTVTYLACASFGNAFNLKSLAITNFNTSCATKTFFGCDLCLYGINGSVMQQFFNKGTLAGTLQYQDIGYFKDAPAEPDEQDGGSASPAPATRATAAPTSSAVLVNGTPVKFQAYTINGNNYFKLRDLAMALRGSSKPFEVRWDSSDNAIIMLSGVPYTPVGRELTSTGDAGSREANLTTSRVYLNGGEIFLTAYLIGGNNYFRLRDVGRALDFGVIWDGAANTIRIDTSMGYVE